MINQKKTIIITGASSGLGASLAIEYANFQHKLFLFGRSEKRLQEITDNCKERGAEVDYVVADVTNANNMEKKLLGIISNHGVDIVIACAGVSAGTLDGPETADQARKIFATNIDGVLNTIMPIIPHMITRRQGNIAIVSSMAGFLGLSSAPSYSASKGAARIFGQAIGSYLKSYNIHVSTIIPGYIETPMTKVNKFPMPFMISPKKASKKIISGIDKNKSVIIFPYIIYLFIQIFNLLPNRLTSYINSKLPGKPSFDK